jgi:tRNA-2-methylthio-N6-dimethylallyladenosine synthase
MNVSDSERIAGFLEARKFKLADDIKKADLVVFNTCGVRQMAEDRVYGQIHNLKKQGTRSKKQNLIILTGCLANRKDVQRRLKDKVDLFFPINDFKKFENWLIENLLKIACPTVPAAGRRVNCKLKIPAQKNNLPICNYLSIKPKYSNIRTAYVPVMTGCNNFCSYCVVPYARGREISRPAEEIIKEIKNLAKKGCKEIILLGQNVNSYRFIDKSSSADEADKSPINFPILLNLLAKSYSITHFKFLTSHPKDFSNDLINVIARNKNISREIHLPIQSGSDKILKLMNRPYTQKKYLGLIQKIKKNIPEAIFTTDVIVGFPGETKKDFAETCKIFKYVKYNEAYINKYSPRPGTAALNLGDPIAWEEKKRREKILREIIRK